jgi:hypothetical protein
MGNTLDGNLELKSDGSWTYTGAGTGDFTVAIYDSNNNLLIETNIVIPLRDDAA